jgi:hypothetical protein
MEPKFVPPAVEQKQSDNHNQDETYWASTALRGQVTWDRFCAPPTAQFPARDSSSGHLVPLRGRRHASDHLPGWSRKGPRPCRTGVETSLRGSPARAARPSGHRPRVHGSRSPRTMARLWPPQWPDSGPWRPRGERDSNRIYFGLALRSDLGDLPAVGIRCLEGDDIGHGMLQRKSRPKAAGNRL